MTKSYGIPILESREIEQIEGRFSIITAIEVIEHLHQPLETLKRIRHLLKEGGVFFYTTGNSRPFKNHILRWRYLIPEIHVVLYEPETMNNALKLSGFYPKQAGRRQGWNKIIRYKILKNLGVRQVNRFERVLPWGWIARLTDYCLRTTQFPVGIAK